MDENLNDAGKLLSEARPTIAELFARDPKGLSDPEIDRMVEVMIEGKARWAKEEAEAKVQGRKPLPSKGLTLEGLDL